MTEFVSSLSLAAALARVSGRELTVDAAADGVVIREAGTKHVLFFTQTHTTDDNQLWLTNMRINPFLRSSCEEFACMIEFVLFSVLRVRRFPLCALRLTAPPEELERLLWSAMGFEFMAPTVIVLRFYELKSIDPIHTDDDVDTSVTAMWAHPLWRALEQIGREYPDKHSDVDVLHTLSETPKYIPCPKCCAHYRRFCTEHDPRVYVRCKTNKKTRFSLEAWVNQCHNSVNARNGKWQWSLDEVRAKLSGQAEHASKPILF